MGDEMIHVFDVTPTYRGEWDSCTYASLQETMELTLDGCEDDEKQVTIKHHMMSAKQFAELLEESKLH